MSDTMNAAADAISDGADSAYAAAEKSAARIGARLSEAGGAVREAASRTGRAMGRGYDRLSEKALDLEAGMADEIQEWPMTSVLIAVGAGIVLGYFLRGGKPVKAKRSRK